MIDDSLNERIATLDRLSGHMAILRAELLRFPEVVKQYQTPEGLFRRTLESTPAAGAGEINRATCTGFTLFLGLKVGVFERSDGRAQFHLLEARSVGAAHKALAQVLPLHQQPAISSDVQTLPNQYDSAIQLAGFLASVRLGADPSDSAATKPACQAIVRFLLALINKTGGFIPSLGSDSAPSPYLTFWSAAALTEYLLCAQVLQLSNDELTEAREAQARVSSWAEILIAMHVANHHAGLSDRFDVAELLCAVQARLSARSDEFMPPIVDHAIAVALSHYMQSGCLVPSWPVLADRENNFSLQCPTVELLAPLLWLAPGPLRRMSEKLIPVASWLQVNRRGEMGWSPENLGYRAAPTVFMTVAALAVLGGLIKLFEDALDASARDILQITPHVPSAKLEGIEYPQNLDPIVRKRILKELGHTPRPPSTPYSMILFGPPGTAKTVITKKLAQDLHWPIKIVNQSEFLRRGMDNIDAEADRMFRLLEHLRDMVVVFDEVEELVRTREGEPDKTSRLLTNAMLPRINDLRERKRIFFIFVTNHLETIDAAILRRGRFDIVQAVMPPDEGTREKILSQLLRQVTAPKEVCDALHDSHHHTEHFCYGHLESFVYNVMRAYQDPEDGRSAAEAEREELRKIKKQLKDKEFDDFKKKEEEYSRS